MFCAVGNLLTVACWRRDVFESASKSSPPAPTLRVCEMPFSRARCPTVLGIIQRYFNGPMLLCAYCPTFCFTTFQRYYIYPTLFSHTKRYFQLSNVTYDWQKGILVRHSREQQRSTVHIYLPLPNVNVNWPTVIRTGQR